MITTGAIHRIRRDLRVLPVNGRQRDEPEVIPTRDRPVQSRAGPGARTRRTRPHRRGCSCPARAARPSRQPRGAPRGPARAPPHPFGAASRNVSSAWFHCDWSVSGAARRRTRTTSEKVSYLRFTFICRLLPRAEGEGELRRHRKEERPGVPLEPLHSDPAVSEALLDDALKGGAKACSRRVRHVRLLSVTGRHCGPMRLAWPRLITRWEDPPRIAGRRTVGTIRAERHGFGALVVRRAPSGNDKGRDAPGFPCESRPSESGRQDLNLRPLGPEARHGRSHRLFPRGIRCYRRVIAWAGFRSDPRMSRTERIGTLMVSDAIQAPRSTLPKSDRERTSRRRHRAERHDEEGEGEVRFQDKHRLARNERERGARHRDHGGVRRPRCGVRAPRGRLPQAATRWRSPRRACA